LLVRSFCNLLVIGHAGGCAVLILIGHSALIGRCILILLRNRVSRAIGGLLCVGFLGVVGLGSIGRRSSRIRLRGRRLLFCCRVAGGCHFSMPVGDSLVHNRRRNKRRSENESYQTFADDHDRSPLT
jgi:hypothetical protein